MKTSSELFHRIAHKQLLLAVRDVDLAVKAMLEHLTGCLASGGRIAIRGFGSFSLHFSLGRVGRNPITEAPLSIPSRYVPYFKPDKVLRERSALALPITSKSAFQGMSQALLNLAVAISWDLDSTRPYPVV